MTTTGTPAAAASRATAASAAFNTTPPSTAMPFAPSSTADTSQPVWVRREKHAAREESGSATTRSDDGRGGPEAAEPGMGADSSPTAAALVRRAPLPSPSTRATITVHARSRFCAHATTHHRTEDRARARGRGNVTGCTLTDLGLLQQAVDRAAGARDHHHGPRGQELAALHAHVVGRQGWAVNTVRSRARPQRASRPQTVGGGGGKGGSV
jgi:hypothetical protein